MVINGQALISAEPISDMLRGKYAKGAVTHGLSEAGYDIRIKQDIRFYRGVFGRRWVEEEVHPGGCGLWAMEPEIKRSRGRFALASSIERFEMPTTLMGIVHDKSSWARRGLSVFNTVIEPGWKGYLTLELVYHGDGELHIPAGSGIAQVVFHMLSCSKSYEGRYQNQANRPVEAISASDPTSSW